MRAVHRSTLLGEAWASATAGLSTLLGEAALRQLAPGSDFVRDPAAFSAYDVMGPAWVIKEVTGILGAYGEHGEGAAGWLSVRFLWGIPEMPAGLSFSCLQRAIL